MNDLIDFLKEKKELDIDLDSYTKIPFFDTPFENTFKEFMRNSRVNIFLRLKLLNSIQCESYFIGHQKYGYFYEELTNENIKKTFEDIKGISLVLKTLSPEQLFETIIRNLSFSQIDTSNAIVLHNISRVPESIPAEKPGYMLKNEILEKEFIISTDLSFLLFEDCFYMKTIDLDKKLVESILDLKSFFKTFIQTHGSKVIIPHHIYLKKLQEIFPGRIKIKTLT